VAALYYCVLLGLVGIGAINLWELRYAPLAIMFALPWASGWNNQPLNSRETGNPDSAQTLSQITDAKIGKVFHARPCTFCEACACAGLTKCTKSATFFDV